jgi:ATP-dependent DNA helicase RecQ
MSYTDEQLKYINYDKKDHTKLLACAGSGKTRCIIARMNKLIEKKIYEPNEVLMLTFSRFTRDDFMNKISSYGGTRININSVKTIDKFAKQIIDPSCGGTVDVSLLSFRLMKFLEGTDSTNLKKDKILNSIKTIFVDEAQDLNEIQYRIFCAMRDKLGIVINMVGDPNQNIYQFRNSSDKYLTEFVGVVFKLTKNFRSHLSIVDFSKHLRPFN